MPGATGPPGTTGATGATGPQGVPGTPGSADAWGRLGTAGTTEGTHFLGTIDNRRLDFRVGNKPALRLEPTPGTANIIGMIPVGTKIELAGSDFLGEKRIQGSVMGSNRFPIDMPRLVDAYMAGHLKLDELISRRIKLEDVNDAFEEMKTGELARSVIMFNA